MAHEIHSSDKFGEVRSGGKRAWHGLGVEIPDGLSAVGGFHSIGLDWQTELLPVYSDLVTPNGVTRIEAKEHRLHVRCDTGDVLGVVSDGYGKIDNGELAKFADSILGEDAAMVMETGMSLHSGRRIVALMRFPQNIVAARGDELATYLAVSNGHGGTASFAAYPTAVRIVCKNTLRLSEKDMARGCRFMHTGDLEGKLRTARMLLGFAHKEIDKLSEQVKAMARRMVTVAELEAFAGEAFAIAFPQPKGDDDEAETLAKWNAKRTETLQAWRVLFDNERNAMESIRGSLWAAFNAVTEWHDHERGRAGEQTDARVHSNLFGVSHVAKAKTMRLAMSMV